MKYYKFKTLKSIDKAIEKKKNNKDVSRRLKRARKDLKERHVTSVEVYY